MNKMYKIIIAVLVFVLLISVVGMLINSNKQKNIDNIPVKTNTEKPKQIQQKNITDKISNEVTTETKNTKHISYDVSNTKLPFSSVIQIAELPDNIKAAIKHTEEDHNVLYFIKENDKAILLVETAEDCPRHELEYIEINTVTGQQTHKLFETISSRNGENDEWTYDKESKRPVKHIIKNSKGNEEYTETWNYDDNEPVKYVLKKADKIISMKKETLDSDTTLRREHIIYDNDGKIRVNISSIYNGPDMTSFTYYDSNNENGSETIVSEYSENGEKVKEIVYSSDYKIKNRYEGEYKDGVLKDIQEISDDNSLESEK